MSNMFLTAQEAAELDFLRWLDASLAGYCGETTDFRARKIAADFGAKHLMRLRGLEEQERQCQQAVDPDEEPVAMAASKQGGGIR